MAQAQELIPMMAAARRLGIAPATLRRRVERLGIQPESDPIDYRLKLLRPNDLLTLTKPGEVNRAEPARVGA